MRIIRIEEADMMDVRENINKAMKYIGKVFSSIEEQMESRQGERYEDYDNGYSSMDERPMRRESYRGGGRSGYRGRYDNY